jgi:hypothetical protein
MLANPRFFTKNGAAGNDSNLCILKITERLAFAGQPVLPDSSRASEPEFYAMEKTLIQGWRMLQDAEFVQDLRNIQFCQLFYRYKNRWNCTLNREGSFHSNFYLVYAKPSGGVRKILSSQYNIGKRLRKQAVQI